MSSPQNSLVVSALMKLDFSRRTLFSENCATMTSMVAVAGRRRLRLSMDIATLSSRDLMEIEIFVVSGTTSGRTLRLCGAIGAMMRTFESGTQIGPPTLNEYAVEPELVETRRPSAQ